jgi:hypothetical protein
VKVTLRYDLPDPADRELAGDIAGHAAAVLRSQGIAAAVTVGYGPGNQVRPLVSAFADAAGAAGIQVPKSLRADDGRYWSYSCREDCCPAAGVPFDQASHPLPAALADSGGTSHRCSPGFAGPHAPELPGERSPAKASPPSAT